MSDEDLKKKTPCDNQKKEEEKPPLKERILIALDPRKDEIPFKRGLVAAIAEFICTFLFVFYATAAVVASNYVNMTPSLIIAFGQGLALALAILIASTISGGHLNPAVTIAVFCVGRISLIRGLMYIVAQFAGAICASGVLKAIVRNNFEGNLGATTVNPDISLTGAFFLEVIMTFTLVFVLFATAIDPRGIGKLAPLCVGLVVLIDDLIGVQWTGGSMNPARTLGPQLVSGKWDHYWLYFFAPVVGAILAAVLYEFYLKIRPYEPRTQSKMSDKKESKDVEAQE